MIVELTSRIKASYPEMAERRRKFEKSSNPSVFNMPLPWTPGWRNLFSGRPMGGNAFETRSYSELFRRVVQQMPYYIPPVLLANLINLVFFVFLLFAVEVSTNSSPISFLALKISMHLVVFYF